MHSIQKLIFYFFFTISMGFSLIGSGNKPVQSIALMLNNAPAYGDSTKDLHDAVVTELLHSVDQNIPIIADTSLLQRLHIPNWKPENAKIIKAYSLYQATHDLCVLIPSQFEQFTQSLPHNPIAKNRHHLTYKELKCGIKIDHLRKLDWNTFIDKSPASPKFYPIPLIQEGWRAVVKTCGIDSRMQSLQNIFVTKDELANPDQLVHWNIILSGHGINGMLGLYGQVADLPINKFKKLLHFFDTKLTINFLIYKTCFGGGRHHKEAFITSGKQDTYSYPIICYGFPDVPTFTFPSSQRFYNSAIDYDTFVQANKPEIVENLPAVRPAGAQSFAYFKLNNFNFIDNNNQKSEYMIDKNSAYLFNTSYAKATFTIYPQLTYHPLVSIKVGPSELYLEKINAPQLSFNDVLTNCFLSVRGFAWLDKKTTLIKEIVCKEGSYKNISIIYEPNGVMPFLALEIATIAEMYAVALLAMNRSQNNKKYIDPALVGSVALYATIVAYINKYSFKGKPITCFPQQDITITADDAQGKTIFAHTWATYPKSWETSKIRSHQLSFKPISHNDSASYRSWFQQQAAKLARASQ